MLKGGCGDVLGEPLKKLGTEEIIPIVSVNKFLPIDAVSHCLDGLQRHFVVAVLNAALRHSFS